MEINGSPRDKRYVLSATLFTLFLLFIVWLNTTAVPVIINVSLIGLVIVFFALLTICYCFYRLSKQPNSFRGKWYLVFLILLNLFLGSWFLYDGFLSFHQEDVKFQNGDLTLAGTIYLPTIECPCPAAVFIHGSGRQTRDEYRFYARKLAQNGIIGLVYDKRGTGESMGNLYSGDYGDYAKDALAGVELLKERQDVNEDIIGLIGYSEGEWVAPIAYNIAQEKPDFIVVIGASGLSPAEQVNSEIKIRLASKGFDDQAIERAISLNDKVFNFQRTGENRDALLMEIRQYSDEPWFTASEDIPADAHELGQFEQYTWWRSVMDTNPDSLWSKVDVPVLFLKGELDDRSKPEIAEQKLRAALMQAGNKDVQFIHFPEADHMILEWPFGEGVPPPLFSEGYLDNMILWISGL